MADKPIIFSAPMIRALLDGRKTQTRRMLKRPTDHFHASLTEARIDGTGWLWWWNGRDRDSRRVYRPPFMPHDRLWVREAWSARMTHGWTIADARSGYYQTELLYRADGEDGIDGWWASIHMPREFSRLTLIVTDVRVQRLQDISEADARAEGWKAPAPGVTGWSPVGWFADLWNSIHGPDAWAANPWVCALTFTVHRCNIDHMLGVRDG